MNNEESTILSKDSLKFNREKQIYFVKFTHTKNESYLFAVLLKLESPNLDLPLTEQTK